MSLPSTKWQHGAPTVSNYRSAYAQIDYAWQRHHERLKQFIESMAKKLVCQECGGAGGEIEPVLDYGEGPFIACGFCEGIGYVTPHIRSLWLRFQKESKIR